MSDDIAAYMGWGLSAQEQIDGFRREVRELKAENALLWEQGVQLFDKTLELETENAKLRELVADAWGYISHHANATWTHKKRKEVRHSLSDRMRELGVEL